MALPDVSVEPAMRVFNNHVRTLGEKLKRIGEIEESLSKGKDLNKIAKKALSSKSAVVGAIDELGNIRESLTYAAYDELKLTLLAKSCNSERDRLTLVQDLLNLLYLGHLFDEKSLQSDITEKTRQRRTRERNYFLSCESTDPVGVTDLYSISLLCGHLICPPAAHSLLSHKGALEKCHAKLWLAKSDEPIMHDSNATYAGLRSKLNSIMSSQYFTADHEDEADAPVEKVNAYTTFLCCFCVNAKVNTLFVINPCLQLMYSQ
uniref:Uncharacterized protein n=1 Tax=Nicotiana tabacum TaxID=4097 RepID=A0A1S3Y8X3_TOBAC